MTVNLIDLKMSPKDKKKMMEPMKVDDSPAYPYGLCLSFESETIGKFPALKNVKGGQKFKVEGIATVQSWSNRGESNGKERASVSLQLTKIGVEPVKGSVPDGSLSDVAKKASQGKL